MVVERNGQDFEESNQLEGRGNGPRPARAGVIHLNPASDRPDFGLELRLRRSIVGLQIEVHVSAPDRQPPGTLHIRRHFYVANLFENSSRVLPFRLTLLKDDGRFQVLSPELYDSSLSRLIGCAEQGFAGPADRAKIGPLLQPVAALTCKPLSH